MDEQFLYYIWKNQKFNTRQLKTVEGADLSVLAPGYQNEDSGPDFREARIKIAEIEWSGSAEMHLKSSDWYRHKHDTDPAYDNVILHVVWNTTKRFGNKMKPYPRWNWSTLLKRTF